MPMTIQQFLVPFHRLVLAYDRFAFVKESDQGLFTDDWYDSFKHYGFEAWDKATVTWKRGHPKFPAQSEMHALLLELIPDMIRERDEQRERERIAKLPPIDPAKLAELKERFRRLRDAHLLKPPEGPSDAPPLLPEGPDGHR
jgi:hypothetical protein